MNENANRATTGGPRAALRTVRLPDLIRAAGEPAIRAYRSLLDNPQLMPKTSYNYERQIARFCAWAEARGLSLLGTNAVEIAAYADSVDARNDTWTLPRYLTGVRRLFDRLMDVGLFDHNPCATSLPEIRRAAQDQLGLAPRLAETPDDRPGAPLVRLVHPRDDDGGGEVPHA
jgi:hypothetical protein